MVSNEHYSNKTIRHKLIFIIIISLFFQLISTTSISFAAGDSFPFKVSLEKFDVTFLDTKIVSVSDSSEVGNSQDNPLNSRIAYNISYHMDIDDYVNPSSSTTSSAIKLKIPNDFVIESAVIPINVVGIDPSSPVKIADVFVESNGDAEIEFVNIDDRYKDTYALSNVYFSIGMKLDESKIVSAGEKEISFNIADKSILKNYYIKPYEEPKPQDLDATLTKNGNLDVTKKTINWTVSVTDTGTKLQPGAYIYDRLDTNYMSLLSVKDSIGNNLTHNYNPTTGELSYVLPDGFSAPYSIIIETKLDENKFQTSGITPVYNKAIIYNPDSSVVSNEASGWVGVTGLGENTLLKEGNYNPKTHRITWKITAHSNISGITETVITDIIDAKEKLDKSSIKLNGSDINPAMFSFDEITNTLSINPGNINSEIKYITFETELLNQEHYASNYIPDQYWNYINRVGMEHKQGVSVLPKISATGYAHIESNILEKEGLSYDYSSKELTWKITVNKNEMVIPNAILQDTLPEGQKYVTDSIIVLTKNNTSVDSSSVLDFSKTENSVIETLSFNFKNKLDAQYSIIFKTKLDDVYAATLFSEAGKKEISNTATLIGDSIYLGKISVTSKKEIENNIISKFGEQKSDGLGIKTDKPVIWEIIVNPNMINIENGVITDKLSSNLELDSSSIKLYEMNVLEDGTKTTGNLVTFLPSDINYNYSQNELQFKLPTPSNKCFKLTFETAVKELASTNVSNEALFSGTGLSKTESSKIENIYVQITSSGGNATKRLGVVKIYKLDSTDPNNKVPLSGAEFEIIDSLGIVRDKQITDINGNAEFKNLRFNEKYSVRESVAPNGYIKSDKLEAVTLTSTEKEKLLTFYNERSKPKTPESPITPSGGGSTPDEPGTPDGGRNTPDKPSTPDSSDNVSDKLSTPDGSGSTPNEPSTPTFEVGNMPTPLAHSTPQPSSEYQINTDTNLDSKDPNANPKTGDMGLEGLLIAVISMYVAFNLRYRFKSE